MAMDSPGGGLMVTLEFVLVSGGIMPYRHAWMFIVALIVATVFAFQRSYFTVLSTASPGFHAHGITASLWMLLLLVQSWTPQRGLIAVHRTLGLATFVAIPLFAAGAMGVIHSMAAGTLGGNPFYALWGARLAFIDAVAFGALLYAAGMALRHRHDVRLHASYMLSTALPLVSPVLGRVLAQTVPGFVVRGPQDFPIFGWSAQCANLCAGIVALWLWRRDPRAGRPWGVAAAVIAVQIVGFETLAKSPSWIAAFLTTARLPLTWLMLFGLMAGSVAVALGWTRPARRDNRPAILA